MYDAVAIGELLIDFACAAAGLSTTRPGGISSVPEYDQVLAAADIGY